MRKDLIAMTEANEKEVCENLSMFELADILYLRFIRTNGIEFMNSVHKENLRRIVKAIKNL